MVLFHSSVAGILGIAVTVVVFAALLLWLLRHLHVQVRFLGWTLVAHIGFILLLGLSVSMKPGSRRSIEDETISVVLLPPLMPRPEVANSEESYIRPETLLRVVPPEQLPQTRQVQSMAAQFLGAPTGEDLDAARLQRLAPDLSSAEFSAQGVVTERPEVGLIGGSSLTATPASYAAQATADAPSPLYRTDEQGPLGRITNRPLGTDRLAATGAPSGRSSALTLPRGYQMAGDVEGRPIRHLPDPPTAEGTDAGVVEISFWVTPDGRVHRIVFKRKAGSPQLERLAKQYVEGIQFAPLDPSVEQRPQSGVITIVFKKE